MNHGVEQEIQVVNEEGHLVYKADQIIDKVSDQLREHGKGGIYKDVYDSQLEIATDVCASLEELEEQLIELRSEIYSAAFESDVYLIATGANPFSKGKVGEYFAEQHHIDAKTKEEKLRLNNFLRIFVPEIFALSSNSPVHDNHITQWKSTRASMDTYDPSKRVNPNIKPAPYLSIEDIERGYLPSFSGEETFEKKRKKSRYYDVSPFTQKDRTTGEYKPTLEIRLLDTHHSVPLTVAYAALFQALAKKAEKVNQIPKLDISHNRSEAIQKGMDAKFIYKRNERRFFHYRELQDSSARAVLESFFDWLKPEIKSLGCEKQIKPLKKLVKFDKNLADWQVSLFSKERENYAPEMIDASMEDFDEPPVEDKLTFKVVDQEEGRESTDWDEDIEEAYEKLKRTISKPYSIDFRTLANSLLAIIECDPNLDEKEADRLIEDMLIPKYTDTNFYYDLLLIDTLFAYEKTSMEIYRNRSEEIITKVSNGILEEKDLWLSAYALTVISSLAGEELDKEKQAKKLKKRVDENSPPWVVGYAVESYANCGLDYEDELKYLEDCLEDGHWICDQTDEITATTLVYNCLKSIGYTNEQVVDWVKERLKSQSVVGQDEMLKLALQLRALSDEVIK